MTSTIEQSRRGPVLLIPVLVWCLVSLADLAVAGQGQEASIIGQVTDESGGVLPGVTVTATSPALQIRQLVDVSNERGEYRLTPLPIGTYTVQYELSGFGTLRRQDIRLTAGFTARVDVQLKVGTLAETITVSGAAPVVDATSTAARTQLTRETLEMIPTSRNSLQSIMTQAPGVRTNLDFGNLTTNPDFRAFGRSNDGWVLVDGVATVSPKSNGNGSAQHFDYASLEESTVQTVGNSADSPVSGINLNLILKSGGNDFHGSAFWSQTGQRLQGSNLDDKLRAQGIASGNPIEERWDVSGDLGGRIVRNKLWFYYAARARRDDVRVLNVLTPDGSPGISPMLQEFSTEKFTYQVNQSNKLLGFHQRQYRNYYQNIDEFTDWDSRINVVWPIDTSKIEWQFVRSNKFVSLQYGLWKHHLTRKGFSNEIATFDQLSLRETGLGDIAPTFTFEGREHAKGTLTWYKPGAAWGNHDVKTGFDFVDAGSDRRTFDRGAAQNYILIFRNGVPFQLDARNMPVYPANHVQHLGIYVQDSWTLARRLTLNLGVRYSNDNGFLPEQCREAVGPPLDVVYAAQCYEHVQFRKFNSVAPRIHAAYDLTGDGRTVIKGGWGRYAHPRYSDEVQTASQNVDLVTGYRWHDVNGNKLFEPGEVNFDRNGPDFIATTRFGSADALAGAVTNPNEKQPRNDEFSLTIERQLIPNFAVRATGIYTRHRNTYRIQNNLRPYDVYKIPITNPDPGSDGRLGTADDPGTFITYWDYPAAFSGRAFQQPMLINDSRSDADYKSVELAASKRLADRWMFMASYSATKLGIPYTPSQTASLGAALTNFDPNAEINAANRTWEWLSRISGAYLFPADVQVSANFEHRSGDSWARQVSFTGGRQIPSITLRVEPIGARRLPNLNILHLRTQKSFRLTRGQSLALRLNVYNALNINTVLTVTQLSGRNFLRPRTIAPPRIAEFSMSYTF